MDKQQQVVQNFLDSLDIEMPMIDHFRNCLRDAMVYKWDSSIVVPIMEGIEDAYKKRNRK